MSAFDSVESKVVTVILTRAGPMLDKSHVTGKTVSNPAHVRLRVVAEEC